MSPTGDQGKRHPALVAGAVTILVVIVGGLSLWLLPDWLADGTPQGAAEDAVRGRVVALLGVLGVLGGLVFTGKSFRLSSQTQAETNRRAVENLVNATEALRLTERGQITDRYAKAVELLGDTSPEICVGGIYALERILGDGPDHEKAIVSTLSAFVRRQAKLDDGTPHQPPWGPDEAERDETKPSFRVQAALNVLSQRAASSNVAPDLRDCDLRGARLDNARLANASFRRSYLYKAKLHDADLRGAALRDADLTEASLQGADLTGASLHGAVLTGANVARAKFTRGSLSREQIDSADNADEIEWQETSGTPDELADDVAE